MNFDLVSLISAFVLGTSAIAISFKSENTKSSKKIKNQKGGTLGTSVEGNNNNNYNNYNNKYNPNLIIGSNITNNNFEEEFVNLQLENDVFKMPKRIAKKSTLITNMIKQTENDEPIPLPISKNSFNKNYMILFKILERNSSVPTIKNKLIQKKTIPHLKDLLFDSQIELSLWIYEEYYDRLNKLLDFLIFLNFEQVIKYVFTLIDPVEFFKHKKELEIESNETNLKMNFKKFEEHYLNALTTSLISDDFKVAYIRSHGDDIFKEEARKVLLRQYPKLEPITDRKKIFEAVNLFRQNRDDCIIKFGPIELWDVSKVTNMSGLFYKAMEFNENIGYWDVSSVTDMSGMFYLAEIFNQPIGNWDVSSVTDMSDMFRYTKFNQPIGKWNVSSVENMKKMFFQAVNFDSPVGDWNVSSVQTMEGMFGEAENFNQDIGNWDVSDVTLMCNMFQGAKKFNKPIHTHIVTQSDETSYVAWNVSNVTDISWMFFCAESFNHDISNWDVSNVQTMEWMFHKAVNFDSPIGNWNVSSVQTMEGMFCEAENFNQDIGNWDVSKVQTMEKMFECAYVFNQDISTKQISAADSLTSEAYTAWDVSKVKNMKRMFFGANNFNKDIRNWDVAAVIYNYNIFIGANSMHDEYKPDFDDE